MTNETDSFVNEVDEHLRRDQAVSLARRYGPYLLGAFVIFLVLIGGWQFWREYQQGQARQHATEYAAAQQLFADGNLAEAKTEFERLSSTGPRVYRAMASMEHAAILAQEGDLEGAIAGFDAAAELAPDQIMRESAQIRAAYIAADTQDFPALRTRLQPLIESVRTHPPPRSSYPHPTRTTNSPSRSPESSAAITSFIRGRFCG